MAKTSIQVLGADEVEKAFAEIYANTEGNLQKTLGYIGQVGTDTAKDNVAFDTGRLKGSITWSIGGKQFGYEFAGEGDEYRDKLPKNSLKDVVIWGTSVVYARIIEYQGGKGGMGGQYLLQSFKRNQALFNRLLKSAIVDPIRRYK